MLEGNLRISYWKSQALGTQETHQRVSSVGEKNGHLPVGREFDLLPHYWVHLHNLVGQPMIIKESSDLTAERASFVLVKSQLQTTFRKLWGEEDDRSLFVQLEHHFHVPYSCCAEIWHSDS